VTTTNDINNLWNSSDGEFLAVIGALALPLVESPAGVLEIGRRGGLYASGGDHLGSGAAEFSHKGLEKIATQFFQIWKKQLKSAICGNFSLGEEIRGKGLQQRDIVVAAIVAALTTHIPELQPYASLLTALAVFIASSGIASFCEMLNKA